MMMIMAKPVRSVKVNASPAQATAVTVAMTGVFIGILIHYVEKKLLAGMRR